MILYLSRVFNFSISLNILFDKSGQFLVADPHIIRSFTIHPQQRVFNRPSWPFSIIIGLLYISSAFFLNLAYFGKSNLLSLLGANSFWSFLWAFSLLDLPWLNWNGSCRQWFHHNSLCAANPNSSTTITSVCHTAWWVFQSIFEVNWSILVDHLYQENGFEAVHRNPSCMEVFDPFWPLARRWFRLPCAVFSLRNNSVFL